MTIKSKKIMDKQNETIAKLRGKLYKIAQIEEVRRELQTEVCTIEKKLEDKKRDLVALTRSLYVECNECDIVGDR